MSGRRACRGVAIAVAIALTACVGTPNQAPKPTKSPKTTPTASTSPSTAPSESAPSTAPSTGVSTAPSTAPSASPSASPSTSPSPAPSNAPKLNEAHQKLVPVVTEKLLTLTKIGFLQSRGSLVSNNSAGIVSQNGGGLVSNHGAGVIANNGSNVIGNNGSTYRVLQAATPTTIAVDPQANETLVSDRDWPDGRRTRWLAAAFANQLDDYRTVNIESNGQPVHQFSQKLLTNTASGKTFEKGNLRLFQDGTFHEYSQYVTTFDTAGTITKLAYTPNVCQFRDPKLGMAIDINELVLDVVAKTGSFSYHYVNLGLVETGTLSNVRLTTTNKVVVNLYDPLGTYDGESVVKDEAGKLLYKKYQTTQGTSQKRVYDLQDGMVLSLVEKSNNHYEGEMLLDGKAEATAVLDTFADGSVVIALTFAEDPDTPLKVGYGVLSGNASPPPAAARPAWTVKTVAGGAEAGYVNGPGAAAQFADLTGIAASRKTAGRFYLADKTNHRIRTMDVASDGSVTIGTYAGDGTAGFLDGPRLAARFFRPYGIAVGPDDTLYVSDLGNHKLRKIAPDGTVSLLAGSTKGHVDAAGASAAFDLPAGIARAEDGTIYVLDQGTSTLRAVTPEGVVSTLAGTAGQAGFADGTGAAARFNLALGLTIGPDDHLYVADMNSRRIRKVSRTGTATTIVGTGEISRSHLDGNPLQGGISLPYALTFGPDGTLYIGSYNVRYLTPAGKLKTYAGDTTQGYRDGKNDESQFNNIFGMAMGPDGVLYVLEGHRVRAIVPPKP